MSALELPSQYEERLKPLGEPIAQFKTGFGRFAGLWVLTMGAFVLGLGLLALLGTTFWLPGGAKLHLKSTFEIGLAALACLSAGVRGVQRIRKTRGVRVLAFSQGLARIQGDSITVLRWDDVVSVQRASLMSKERGKMQPARKLTLTAGDGKTLELDESLSDLRTLRELAEQHTLPHLFDPILDRYEAGERVAFGLLSADSDGLHSGRKTLAWSDCEEINVARGYVSVKAQGAWLSFCKAPLHQVPNVHVLIALAEYIRKYAT